MKRLLLTLPGVLMASQPAQSRILLNEVHLNPPNGTDLGDRNYEYIELRSDTNTVESTTGLTLIIVNNDRWDFKPSPQNPNQEVATDLNLGEVTEIWSLQDMKTGSNGLLLLGDKYTELPKGGPWSGFIDPATEVGDPAGMGDGNIRSNDGLSIFLIRDFIPPAPGVVMDFDADENGVLDWLQATPHMGLQTPPWNPQTGGIVDQIGTRDRNTDPWPIPPPPASLGVGIAEPYTGLANGVSANLNFFYTVTQPNWSIGPRDPDSFSRNANLLTASNAASWYGGKYADALPGTDPVNSLAYRPDRIFGLFNGTATPGRANLSADPGPADFRINEVNLDPSTSNRFQYVEIVNTNAQPGINSLNSRSLNGWWLVLVDSNVSTADAGQPNKVGSVIEEWDLSAMATGTNGFLLIADDAASSYTVFEDYVPAETGKGDPVGSDNNPKSSGFGAGDLGSKSGFSMFLIKGYKSGVDAGLAAGRDLDANDDGLLDQSADIVLNFASAANAPNVSVKDSVGFDSAGNPPGAGKTYAQVNLRTVFPDFPAGDANKASDSFSRKVSGGLAVTTNTPGSWYGGEYPSGYGFNLGFQPPLDSQKTALNPTGTTHFGGFRGASTPGRPNLGAPIDPLAPPIAADIRINEVMFDPTDFTDGGDKNRDYIELVSTNRALAYLDGYWIVVIDNSGSNKGAVKTGAPLDGQTTGLNGLLLLGDNYDSATASPYLFVEGPFPPSTAPVDPVVAFSGDDIPNNGATVLLIRGPAYVDPQTTPNGPFKVGGPISLQINLKPAGDIDPDNDGVLLPPGDWLAPGAVLVDAVSFGAVSPGPQYGYLPQSSPLPDCAARYPGKFTANAPAEWYYGEVSQTASTFPSTAFTTYAGDFRGHASPGRWNHDAAVGPETLGAVLLNEVHFNPAGADGNFEFVEILDLAGTSRSLNRYSLVMLDNVKNNTGVIQRAWSLDGAKTGPNGLCIVTNGTREDGPHKSPWAAVASADTSFFDPFGRDDLLTGFGDATIGTESDNQSILLILVRDFSSTIGADLDITPPPPPGPATGNGDGVIDNAGAAWGEKGYVQDSVGLRSWLVAEGTTPADWNGFVYTGFTTEIPPTLPVTFTLADLSSAFFGTTPTLFYHPETVARRRGMNGPNNPAAWYGGDLVGGASGNDASDTTYITNDDTHKPVPFGFTGRTTPGQPNLSSSVPSSGYDAWAANFPGIGGPTEDADQDTFSNLLEYAGGSNPTTGKSLPPYTLNQTGSTLKATWTKGPEAAGDSSLSWSIEASTSMTAGTWSSAGVAIVQNATSISGDVVISPGTPKTFLRLKVVRTP